MAKTQHLHKIIPHTKKVRFIHAVLFGINPQEVKKYHRDCRLWASYAKEAKGFIGCFTMKRIGFKNQYASVYEWKTRRDHNRFMNKFHDWLVGQSKARVEVLGYYNLKEILGVRCPD